MFEILEHQYIHMYITEIINKLSQGVQELTPIPVLERESVHNTILFSKTSS